MMHTEIYCGSLDRLTREEAIRAIHQAALQLTATASAARAEGFDNFPAIAALDRCLNAAGHPGYSQKDASK
jgi:hypothetical protein